LRAACLALAGLARNVREVARVARVADIDDRRAAVLGATGDRIQRFSAVMPDVGDPAPALRMHDRLIGAARLQVVVADEIHVARARRMLRMRRGEQE
jgi:hypothetical protein